MQDDDYIRTPKILDTLEDLNQPGIRPLEAALRSITADLVESGPPSPKLNSEIMLSQHGIKSPSCPDV